jgi:hypothetical protein
MSAATTAVRTTSDARARIALALALALALLGGWSGVAHAQFFSPGPLAKPHTSLEGMDKCDRCHDQQQRQTAARCLACHTELAASLNQRAGLHGRMAPETRDKCQQCHPDHRGREFHLIDWQGDRQGFDHKRTGWALEGQHAKTRCGACHDRTKVVAADVVKLLASQPHRESFLGLSKRCDACHFDEHRGQLGNECQRCHGLSSFKPAPGFNHQATSYPLRGKHKAVPCGKCHESIEDEAPPAATFPKPRAASFMQMKPVEHDTCESCHDDPHEGKLGPRCSNCHTETSWKSIITGPAGEQERGFHKRTQFPLLGAHMFVPCQSCHGPFPGTAARFKGLAFARCADCHDDAHVGQLTGPGSKRAPDCASCHDVAAFTPPRFEVEQHARTRFPLEGAHRAAACGGCHPVDEALEALVPAYVHAKLRRERRPELLSLAVMRPEKVPGQCSACHADVHLGQFAQEMQKDDCAACHKTASFTTDLRFDHDRQSRFPLEGAHRKAACGSCHLVEKIRPDAPPAVRYKPLKITCGGCHPDEHQGQFTWEAAAPGRPRVAAARRRAPPDCSFCHDTSTFKATLFSHDDKRFTSFALLGKHAKLACGACHARVEASPGLLAVRYRPLSNRCADCHVDFHKGDFRGFEP